MGLVRYNKQRYKVAGKGDENLNPRKIWPSMYWLSVDLITTTRATDLVLHDCTGERLIVQLFSHQVLAVGVREVRTSLRKFKEKM